ncbi:MAG: hypothetical protein ACERKV_13265, partial [Clostridiaceae bacterium]
SLGLVEEKMISFSSSFINILMESNREVQVAINNKNKEVFQLKDKKDFNDLLYYLIKNKSEGEKSFRDFLNEYKDIEALDEIDIFSVNLDKEMIEFLMKHTKYCKINFFYLIKIFEENIIENERLSIVKVN